MSSAPSLPNENAARGYALGLLGVALFAMTLPMTRLAVGSDAAPQLPPGFVTAGRAAVAGCLSVAWLAWHRAPRPSASLRRPLALSAFGTVFAFPLALALALRRVDAMHAAVVTGLLPLATAAVAAVALRQRPSAAFWICACTGCAIVVSFAAWRGGGALGWGDALLLLAVLGASVGYVGGARVATERPASEVICWVLVMSLPLTLPAALWSWPSAPVRWQAWLGFAYVSLFSMWLGFFAWYRGLVLGGVVKVSQVQLLQPFLALLFAVPVLGERLDASTLLFSVAVIATVHLGRRATVRAA
ncbi:MAG: DMT family transporter [Burkholderiales bacterium]|nr:DMT family transporter [Burkholderiales bacterium]